MVSTFQIINDFAIYLLVAILSGFGVWYLEASIFWTVMMVSVIGIFFGVKLTEFYSMKVRLEDDK